MKDGVRLIRLVRGACATAVVLLPLNAFALEASEAKLQEAYGKLPLSFEANAGQLDRRVRFQSRGAGYGLFFAPTELVLMLRDRTGADQAAKAPTARPGGAGEREPAINGSVHVQLVGANPDPEIEGLEQLPGTANYFVGKDPAKWHTNVRTYAKLKYHAVYPGVDVVYYGNQQRLEFDFVVAPGADASSIRLKIEGADRLDIDVHGNLVLDIGNGQVRLPKPFVYQVSDGVQHPISGGYVLTGRQVSFQVAAYDGSRPLVIDPTIEYSTYLGGTDADEGWHIAVDAAGNAYAFGWTRSTDFPTTPGAVSPGHNAGVLDLFVTKLNRTGTALIYSTFLGGNGLGYPRGSIAVDAAGNAYVCGSTSSTDFPTTAGAFQESSDGSGDGFVTKLNPSGAALVYSTYLGGSSGDGCNGIAVDRAGNAYVTGATGSADFPTTPGAVSPSLNGSGDVFVTKLNPSGTALVYSTYLGGSASDSGNAIAIDSAGNAYVTGRTNSPDFPTTPGAFDRSLTGSGPYLSNAFVAKLDATGAKVLYATYLASGGAANGSTYTTAIAVDPAGSAYVTGWAADSDFPVTPGAFQPTNHSGRIPGGDAFVTKFNADGSALVYSTFLGGDGYDVGEGIVVDHTGHAYVTGYTSALDFPVTEGSGVTSFQGAAFVTKLNQSGTGLAYSIALGGSQGTIGYGIAIDACGNAYVTGSTHTPDFPTTAGAFDTTFNGPDSLDDAFVAKIRNDGRRRRHCHP